MFTIDIKSFLFFPPIFSSNIVLVRNMQHYVQVFHQNELFSCVCFLFVWLFFVFVVFCFLGRGTLAKLYCNICFPQASLHQDQGRKTTDSNKSTSMLHLLPKAMRNQSELNLLVASMGAKYWYHLCMIVMSASTPSSVAQVTSQRTISLRRQFRVIRVIRITCKIILNASVISGIKINSHLS